jgi:hypothetical protein
LEDPDRRQIAAKTISDKTVARFIILESLDHVVFPVLVVHRFASYLFCGASTPESASTPFGNRCP